MAHADEAIVAALQDVWRMPTDRVIDIIQHLDQDVPTRDYFIQCVGELKPLSKSASGDIRIAHANNDIVENSIKGGPIGSGTYGQVSLSVKGRVYKQITVDAATVYELELAFREIFLETFIQTVLSRNEYVKNNIPYIYNLYRSEKTPGSEYVLYIVMEHVPHTLKSVVTGILRAKHSMQAGITDVSPLLVQIGGALLELFELYKFHHGDLHAGNVMFAEDRKTVKLIDFGKSCMTIEGVTYSIVSENIGTDVAVKNAECKSWDLLILLTYLLQYNPNMLNTELKAIFHRVMTTDNGVDIYETVKSFAERRGIPLFHAMYADRVNEWPKKLRIDLIQNTPLLEPMAFVNYMIDLHMDVLAKGNVSSRRVFEPMSIVPGRKIAGLHRMAKNNRKNTRKNSRRHNRKSGGGYQTSQQWFDPDVLPPATILAAPSTAPTATEIRPVLYSTFQSGAGRRTRRNRKHGGFSPSVMGGFVANAQAAIVPLALYTVYHTMIPKTGDAKLGFNSKKSRKNARSRK